jgi:hypothetical protein
VVELLDAQLGGMATLAMLDLQYYGDCLGSPKDSSNGNEDVVEAKSLDNTCTCKAARQG